ncbi:MAG: hypothetical protein Q9208_008671 [Pyrenodesmia sp. 3 TL-2023]
MTKRKTEEEKAQRISQPRKRKAFSAPKAATKAIIVRNASESPLLRLPLEIRNKIWNEVLGDRLVHIFRRSNTELGSETDEELNRALGLPNTSKKSQKCQLGHKICLQDGPENRPDQKVGVGFHVGTEKEISWIRPHEFCGDNRDKYYACRPGLEEFWKIETMQLASLRASRQTYVEANHILWTTNTLSFATATTFKGFMLTRNNHQKSLIRSLRIEMERGHGLGSSYTAWNSAFTIAMHFDNTFAPAGEEVKVVKRQSPQVRHSITEETVQIQGVNSARPLMSSWDRCGHLAVRGKTFTIQDASLVEFVVRVQELVRVLTCTKAADHCAIERITPMLALDSIRQLLHGFKNVMPPSL